MKGLMLFADSFEDIEALGTLDLIRRAKIEIETVSITGKKEVLSQSKVLIQTEKQIEEVNLDEYDFLIIPGGAAVMKTHLNSPITESVATYFYNKGLLIGCICAAPSVLGKYGMLENRKYTCFPSFEKLVIGGTYLPNEKVVVDGNIITSKAAGTTIDFAYEIIKYLKSESIANHIKEAVFYN